MCIKNVKKQKRPTWGVGYKVFTLRENRPHSPIILGDWTLGRERPVGLYIHHADYKPKLMYQSAGYTPDPSVPSHVPGGGNVTHKDWPDGFSLFLTWKDAEIWRRSNAWGRLGGRSNGVYKIRYKKATHRGVSGTTDTSNCSYVELPTLIAEEIKILYPVSIRGIKKLRLA